MKNINLHFHEELKLSARSAYHYKLLLKKYVKHKLYEDLIVKVLQNHRSQLTWGHIESPFPLLTGGPIEVFCASAYFWPLNAITKQKRLLQHYNYVGYKDGRIKDM